MEIHLGIEIVESAGLFQVVCLPPNSDARGWDCIWIPCSKVIDYSSHEVPLSTSLEILNCHKSPLIKFILGSNHDQRQLKSFIHVKDLIRKLLMCWSSSIGISLIPRHLSEHVFYHPCAVTDSPESCQVLMGGSLTPHQ